jgi:glycosyltransferase involved in cell wall biosynthesis
MPTTNVLFMQSQSFFGSDSMIHSLVMRHLDRSAYTVHAACNLGSPGAPSASIQALEQIPNLHLRPTHFGASINFRTKKQIAQDTITGAVPALRSMAGLVRYAKRHQIDIIHGTEKPRDAFYGYLLARLVGAACIIHLHVGIDHSWMSPLTQYAMRHADGLLGVSGFVAESARRTGYDSRRIYHVVNSVDAARWDPNTDGSRVRQEYGIAPDTVVLSILARVFPWKGHTQLLQALAQIKPQFGNFKLLLVGEDDIRATPGHQSYMGELRNLTRELGLEDHVVFTGFRRDVPQILAASDVYAMPSYEEPCAVAFLEAMAMSRPVIALDSGGTSQLVDHGRAGLLSKPYDIDELATNILTLLRDGELRREMGAYARRRVEEHYTPQRLAGEVAQVYAQVLAARGKQPRSPGILSVSK